MILSNKELTEAAASGAVKNPVKPLVIDQVSICLHLDNQFCQYVEYPSTPVVPPHPLKCENLVLKETDKITLPPHGKILGCSQEIVFMPLDLMGFVQTKGSLARGFLMAHACDGQIDPGYIGKITLEIINLSDFYYDLVPGMPFACLFLHQLSSPVQEGYAGRYQQSFAPTPMR